MREIICDTNIWYDLPDDYQPNGGILVPTFCNTFELSHTKNLIYRFDVAKRTIESIHNGRYLEKYYWFNPFAHVMFLESGKAPYLESDVATKDFFLDIATGKVDEKHVKQLPHPENKEIELKEIAERLNLMLDDEIVTIENDMEKSIEWTKVFISWRVTEWAKTLGIEYYMNKNFDWNKIELFLNVKALFLRKVVFNRMKYSHKDMFDLWNMVYVLPGNLYWTKEGQNTKRVRWHNLIIEAEMGHYLYNENGV